MTLPGCHEPWQRWPPPDEQTTEIEIEVPAADATTVDPVIVVLRSSGMSWWYESTGFPLDHVPQRWRPVATEPPTPWAAPHKAAADRCRALLDELRVRVGLIERRPPAAGTVQQLEGLAGRLSPIEARADAAAKAWEIACLASRGEILNGECSHYCPDLEGLPVDETVVDFERCKCYGAVEGRDLPLAEDADAAEAWRYLAALGEEIATQDGATRGTNAEHGTADPVYMATQIERVYGIDPGHTDPDGYLVSDGDIEDGEHWTPQRYHECDSDGLSVIPYVERRALVEGAISLTRGGIEAYVDRHAHNLDRPEIYVASLCHMPSMIKLRRALIDLSSEEFVRRQRAERDHGLPGDLPGVGAAELGDLRIKWDIEDEWVMIEDLVEYEGVTVGIHLELDGVIRVLSQIRERAART